MQDMFCDYKLSDTIVSEFHRMIYNGLEDYLNHYVFIARDTKCILSFCL
jgi:hypothetical protein